MELWLGPAFMGTLLLLAFIIIASKGNFLNHTNTFNILRQFSLYGVIAYIVAISIRARGLDVSCIGSVGLIGTIYAIIGNATGSALFCFFIAILLGIVLGAMNGALITFLRLPALPVTIVSGLFCKVVALALADGRPIFLAFESFMKIIAEGVFIGIIPFMLLPLILLFGLPFCIIAFTSLRRERGQRIWCFMDMTAYIFTGGLAAIYTIMFVERIRSAVPTLSYDPIPVLFIAACLFSTRLTKRRFTPVPLALGGTLLYVVISNALILLQASAYVSQIVFAVLALALFVIAGVSRLKKKEDLPI